MDTLSKLPSRYVERIKRGEEVADVLWDFVQDEGDANYIDTLGELCEHGGYPDENVDPTYQFVTFTSAQKNVYVLDLTAHFDEKVFGGGCPDMFSIFPISGPIKLEMDFNTKEIQWTSALGED